MANLGEQLWRSDENRTASIRLIRLQYVTPCESKSKCAQRAALGVECRDKIGHPIWRRDLCDQHAQLIIERAKEHGIEVFEH